MSHEFLYKAMFDCQAPTSPESLKNHSAEFVSGDWKLVLIHSCLLRDIHVQIMQIKIAATFRELASHQIHSSFRSDWNRSCNVHEDNAQRSAA